MSKKLTPEQAQMVIDNLGLVRHVAKKSFHVCINSSEYDDVIQAGSIGLIHAVSTFDADKQLEFSTFACVCIKGAILNYIQRVNEPIKYSGCRDHISKIRQLLKKELTPEEISEQMSVDISVVSDITNIIQNTTSLQNVFSNGRGPNRNTSFEEIIADEHVCVEDTAVTSALVEEIYKHNTREAAAVAKRYYIDGWNQVKIAEEFGQSQVWVSRQLKRFITRSREFLGLPKEDHKSKTKTKYEQCCKMLAAGKSRDSILQACELSAECYRSYKYRYNKAINATSC